LGLASTDPWKEDRQVGSYPSLTGKKLFRILSKAPLDYTVSRRKGFHRTMVSESYSKILFSDHDFQIISPRAVRDILEKQVGLGNTEEMKLLSKGN